MIRNRLIIWIGEIRKAVPSIHRINMAKVVTSIHRFQVAEVVNGIHRVRLAVLGIPVVMSSFLVFYS